MLAVHLPTYRPLRHCGHEELAAHVATATPSGGILFARKPSEEQKLAAREAILDLFWPENWPGRLHMLTMPGLKWKLEGVLMKRRESAVLTRGKPELTQFSMAQIAIRKPAKAATEGAP